MNDYESGVKRASYACPKARAYSKTNHWQRDLLNKRFAREDQQSLTAEQAVFVLVRFIRNPSLSFKELARLLRRQRQAVVSAECIEAFFQKHHIKKTICRV